MSDYTAPTPRIRTRCIVDSGDSGSESVIDISPTSSNTSLRTTRQTTRQRKTTRPIIVSSDSEMTGVNSNTGTASNSPNTHTLSQSPAYTVPIETTYGQQFSEISTDYGSTTEAYTDSDADNEESCLFSSPPSSRPATPEGDTPGVKAIQDSVSNLSVKGQDDVTPCAEADTPGVKAIQDSVSNLSVNGTDDATPRPDVSHIKLS
jgi:hypothetical protein